MDLGEVGWGDVDWIGLAQDRNRSCEFGIELPGSIKCWEIIEWHHNWWLSYTHKETKSTTTTTDGRP
jgi:hypothetical protein